MKKSAFVLAISGLMASSAMAGNLSVYKFSPIVWSDKAIDETLPMICDDNAYDAVAIFAPGVENQQFRYKIEGDTGCKLVSSTFNRSLGYTRLVIENTGDCTITVESRSGETAVYELSDGC